MRKLKFLDVSSDDMETIVRIDGEIMSDSDKDFYEQYLGMDKAGTSPSGFMEDLDKGSGNPVTVYINSVGGDVFAASSIYNALSEYKGDITVKIDGLAASSASFIAMAGDRVLMSPTAQIMIHNPSSYTEGDSREMNKTAGILDGIKESIMNAYEKKTGMSRDALSKFMDDELWMTAEMAIANKFADGYIEGKEKSVSNDTIKKYYDRHQLVYDAARRHSDEASAGKERQASDDAMKDQATSVFYLLTHM